MKRISLVVSLVVCLLMVGQAVCVAETLPVTSVDEPGFDGGSVAVPATDTDWDSSADFNSFPEKALPLLAEESAAAAVKQAELDSSLSAAAQSSTSLSSALAGTTESNWADTTTDPALAPSGLPLPGIWYGYVKLPNYNQGATPYCGPFSAYQILRYMRYNEANLMSNLIREMYIPGQGSSIYRLAKSLNKRLYFTYIVSDVGTPTQYAYKHVVNIRNHKMPLDNLLRISAGKLGRYRRYHAGHFIDSNGYHINQPKGFAYLAVTDTYDESETGGGLTLGRHWIPFWQMYRAVSIHPKHKVVW